MKEKIKEIYKAKEALDQLRKQIDKKSTTAKERDRLNELLQEGQKAMVTLMVDVDTSYIHWILSVDEKECEQKIIAMFDWIEKASDDDLDFFNSWGYGCEQANVACAILDEIFNNFQLSQIFSAEFMIGLFQRWVKFTIWDKKKKIGFVKEVIERGWKGQVDFWQGRNFREMIKQLDHGV